MAERTLMKLQNGSDVRGVALDGVEGEPVTLTEEAANVIAKTFALWLSQKTAKPLPDLKIGIGRDARVTGEALARAAASGIASVRAQAADCGLATTPALFMSTVFDETKFDGALMVTASHLPFNRNGMKFFTAEGGLEHDEITALLEAAQKQEPGQTDTPYRFSCDLISLYASYLKQAICRELGSREESRPLSGLKIIVDAGNGDAGFFTEKILEPLGADTSGSLYLEPDGMFPNHIPNPENRQAMQAIQKATVDSGADLGLIFDTDVDRMSTVFHTGAEVSRDAIIALVAAILAPAYPGSTIVTDSVTSDRLTYFLEQKLGLVHLRYMRGYKNVIDKCRELNAGGTVSPLAMETSGHGALKDNYYLDDGAFLAVKLIAALAKAAREHKNIESFIAQLPPAGAEAEFRLKITAEQFREYGTDVLESFKERAKKKGFTLPESFEGVRISFREKGTEGWLLLRLSLHDPVMPLNVEGKTPEDRDAIVLAAKELLKGFSQLDTSSLG